MFIGESFLGQSSTPYFSIGLIEVVILALTLVTTAVFAFLGLRAQRREFHEQQQAQRREFEAQREHNRLSVKPDVVIFLNFKTDEPVVLGLTNCGLGPAMLTEIIFTTHYGTKHSARSFNDINELMESSGLEWASGSIGSGPTSLPANESLELMKFEDSTEDNIEAIKNFIFSLTLKVQYESLYGEEFLIHIDLLAYLVQAGYKKADRN